MPSHEQMTNQTNQTHFDKCCLCIELKIGCFIIGFLKLIANIILLLITGFFLVGAIAMANDEDKQNHEAGIGFAAIFGVFMLFVILSLVFAIILLVGIRQDKPGHVKAFLIYGVVYTILEAIFTISNVFFLSVVTTFGIVLLIILMLLEIYFLLVIRSHYYRMKDSRPAIYNTV